MTFGIRVFLIHMIAPPAIFFMFALRFFFLILGNLFTVAFYGFFIFGVFVAFWKCIHGPSLQTVVGRTQERLGRWKENERLRFLPLNAVQMKLDRLFNRPAGGDRERGGESKEQGVV
jgi:hypothetical protein